MRQRAFDNPKIDFIWDSTVQEILGEEKVEGALLKNVKTGEISTFECQGIFIAIGHKPATEIFDGKLDRDDNGYLVPRNHTQTNIEGVFVSGDVHDSRYRQVVTAAGIGCQAALDAEKYLEHDHS